MIATRSSEHGECVPLSAPRRDSHLPLSCITHVSECIDTSSSMRADSSEAYRSCLCAVCSGR